MSGLTLLGQELSARVGALSEEMERLDRRVRFGEFGDLTQAVRDLELAITNARRYHEVLAVEGRCDLCVDFLKKFTNDDALLARFKEVWDELEVAKSETSATPQYPDPAKYYEKEAIERGIRAVLYDISVELEKIEDDMQKQAGFETVSLVLEVLLGVRDSFGPDCPKDQTAFWGDVEKALCFLNLEERRAIDDRYCIGACPEDLDETGRRFCYNFTREGSERFLAIFRDGYVTAEKVCALKIQAFGTEMDKLDVGVAAAEAYLNKRDQAGVVKRRCFDQLAEDAAAKREESPPPKEQRTT